MKRIATHLGAGALALCTVTNRALADTPVADLPSKPLVHALLSSVIFAVVGMFAVFVAVIVFDKATPRIDIQKELLNNNIAVAILTAAVVIGVSIIVAASIM
jgi:putative membrane protein